MTQPKFRASYTVLSLWQSGAWQRAIEAYFKLKPFTTPEMEAGRRWHRQWCDYIETYGKLPPEFGGTALSQPVCEKKQVVQLNEWCDLVYIVDCYDKPILHEFKTGKKTSEEYAGEMQIKLYSAGATLSGLYVKEAVIHRYDQYAKKYDASYVWITDKMLDEAYNWAITLGGEMQDYITQNGLYDRFGVPKPGKI